MSIYYYDLGPEGAPVDLLLAPQYSAEIVRTVTNLDGIGVLAIGGEIELDLTPDHWPNPPVSYLLKVAPDATVAQVEIKLSSEQAQLRQNKLMLYDTTELEREDCHDVSRTQPLYWINGSNKRGRFSVLGVVSIFPLRKNDR